MVSSDLLFSPPFWHLFSSLVIYGIKIAAMSECVTKNTSFVCSFSLF